MTQINSQLQCTHATLDAAREQNSSSSSSSFSIQNIDSNCECEDKLEHEQFEGGVSKIHKSNSKTSD